MSTQQQQTGTAAATTTTPEQAKVTEQDLSQLLEKVLAKTAASRNVVHDEGPFSNYLDTAKFDHAWRIARTFAASSMVPEHFRGKDNEANCFIGVQMALRLGVDPLMFLQNSYIVHGKPGIEAKLAIALANSSGVFTGPIQYKIEGEGKVRRWTAYATMTKTKEQVSFTVPWSMVEGEGWNTDRATKGGGVQKSKWNTMPEVMGCYRSAMFLLRTHCPEVIMGMQSREELDDAPAPVRELDQLPVGKMNLRNGSPPISNGTPETKEEPTKAEALPENDELRLRVEERIKELAMSPQDIRAVLEAVGCHPPGLAKMAKAHAEAFLKKVAGEVAPEAVGAGTSSRGFFDDK